MSNATSRMPAAMASGIVLRGRSPRVIAARLLGAVPALQAAHRLEPSGPIEDRIAAIESRVAGRLGTKTFAVETGRGRQLAIAEVRVEALQAARSGGAQPLVSPGAARRNDHASSGLTARELDVLRLIAAGKTDRQIAAALFISPKTANHHVTRILAKLECRNRAAATALAFHQGLV